PSKQWSTTQPTGRVQVKPRSTAWPLGHAPKKSPLDFKTASTCYELHETRLRSSDT
ncbi:unnamed protein product, partial [Dovyalis caffra]